MSAGEAFPHEPRPWGSGVPEHDASPGLPRVIATPAGLAGLEGRHVAVAAMARKFAWGQLPEHLQEISRPIAIAAATMAELLPDGPDLTDGLRKLWEAKNSFVVAAIGS